MQDSRLGIGTRIRKARDLAGVSQKRLNFAAGLTAGHLSRLESGKRGKIRPCHVTIEAVARALRDYGVEVTAGWIEQEYGDPPRLLKKKNRRVSAPRMEASQ